MFDGKQKSVFLVLLICNLFKISSIEHEKKLETKFSSDSIRKL